jgi:hypothetical protein
MRRSLSATGPGAPQRRATRTPGAEKMPYYLYMRAAGGTETRLDRAYNSIEDAMTPACGALRARGITDAWVVDENGMKHADLEAIKEYCSQKT